MVSSCQDWTHEFVISRYQCAMQFLSVLKTSFRAGQINSDLSIYQARCLFYSECEQIEILLSVLERRVSRFESQILASSKVDLFTLFLFTYAFF